MSGTKKESGKPAALVGSGNPGGIVDVVKSLSRKISPSSVHTRTDGCDAMPSLPSLRQPSEIATVALSTTAGIRNHSIAEIVRVKDVVELFYESNTPVIAGQIAEKIHKFV